MKGGALLPQGSFTALPPRDFLLEAEAGEGKMRAAVTEDKALLGSNLSAGDGPKLAGVALAPLLGLPLLVWLVLFP
jgi:hypothetical protein